MLRNHLTSIFLFALIALSFCQSEVGPGVVQQASQTVPPNAQNVSRQVQTVVQKVLPSQAGPKIQGQNGQRNGTEQQTTSGKGNSGTNKQDKIARSSQLTKPSFKILQESATAVINDVKLALPEIQKIQQAFETVQRGADSFQSVVDLSALLVLFDSMDGALGSVEHNVTAIIREARKVRAVLRKSSSDLRSLVTNAVRTPGQTTHPVANPRDVKSAISALTQEAHQSVLQQLKTGIQSNLTRMKTELIPAIPKVQNTTTNEHSVSETNEQSVSETTDVTTVVDTVSTVNTVSEVEVSSNVAHTVPGDIASSIGNALPGDVVDAHPDVSAFIPQIAAEDFAGGFAVADASSSLPSSPSSAPVLPGWGFALIVIGALIAIGFVLVIIQLFVYLRTQE